MKRSKISNNVIRRLPRYLRDLNDLYTHGVERISSRELSIRMGLTPSQIRQDFSCFGEFGQQGYGYNVTHLRKEISGILGMNRGYNVILIGVGNLGRALARNFGFHDNGFSLRAMFDASPDVVGREIAGLKVCDISELPHFLSENAIDIAVLAVPKAAADAVAALAAENDVRAIWNFTDVDLDLRSRNIIVENIHFSDSLLTLSYYLSESQDSAHEAESASETEGQTEADTTT